MTNIPYTIPEHIQKIKRFEPSNRNKTDSKEEWNKYLRPYGRLYANNDVFIWNILPLILNKDDDKLENFLEIILKDESEYNQRKYSNLSARFFYNINNRLPLYSTKSDKNKNFKFHTNSFLSSYDKLTRNSDFIINQILNDKIKDALEFLEYDDLKKHIHYIALKLRSPGQAEDLRRSIEELIEDLTFIHYITKEKLAAYLFSEKRLHLYTQLEIDQNNCTPQDIEELLIVLQYSLKYLQYPELSPEYLIKTYTAYQHLKNIYNKFYSVDTTNEILNTKECNIHKEYLNIDPIIDNNFIYYNSLIYHSFNMSKVQQKLDIMNLLVDYSSVVQCNNIIRNLNIKENTTGLEIELPMFE